MVGSDEGLVLAPPSSSQAWRQLLTRHRFTAVYAVDSLQSWMGSPDGFLVATENGGRSWRSSRLPASETVRHLAFSTPRHGFAYTDDSTFETRDRGRTWRSRTSAQIPLVFFDSLVGWAGSDDSDSLYVTGDGGETWRADPKAWLTAILSDSVAGDASSVSVRFDPLAKDTLVWIVSDSGFWSYQHGRLSRDTIKLGLTAASRVTTSLGYGLDSLGNLVRTSDGGKTWAEIAIRPRRYPAPWYYLFLGICILVTMVSIPAPAEAERKSVADLLVSDRPLRETDRDVLDFAAIAGGLSRFLRNTRTQPPLTIAVTGKWGTGKSSLMLMLQRDLEGHRFRTVWFNAWHHQREESLLASLLESIRQRAVPAIWTLKGLRFRFRLLGARYRRYWRPLTFMLPLFAIAVGWFLADSDQRIVELRNVVLSLYHLVRNGKVDPVPGSERTVFFFVISVAGTIWTYMKGLKPFGVSPAVLAKSLASATKMRTLELQTGFRYRFAQDFKEVTQALSPERLVVFIDDLDRCKPEQVLEILESVNFLVESGECVVVLGMDRERVIGCVGIGFKDVAGILSESDAPPPPPAEQAELAVAALRIARADDAGGDPTSIVPAAPVKSQAQIQADYARQYLEKLINMEIAIPPVDAKDLGNVMTASLDQMPAGPPAKTPLLDRLARFRRPLQAAAVIAVSVAGFLVAFKPPRWLSRSEPPSVVVPASSPPAATATSGATLAGNAGSTKPAVTQTNDDLTHRRSAVNLIPGTAGKRSWWPLALGLFLALGFMVWLLIPTEPHRVEDSPAFGVALKAWSPVLYSSMRTPRSAKKFLNRVRYLAMLQRDVPKALRPAERAIGWLREHSRPIDWLLERLGFPELEEEVPSLEKIPENVLVALSVVRETRPDWLAEPDFWTMPIQRFATSQGQAIPEKLEQALEEVGIMPALKNYKADWLKVSLGVRSG
jgi:hypothetical protein